MRVVALVERPVRLVGFVSEERLRRRGAPRLAELILLLQLIVSGQREIESAVVACLPVAWTVVCVAVDPAAKAPVRWGRLDSGTHEARAGKSRQDQA